MAGLGDGSRCPYQLVDAVRLVDNAKIQGERVEGFRATGNRATASVLRGADLELRLYHWEVNGG